jgi:signal transduction histidine kinase
MGLGVVGARRLSDRFDITSAPGTGTTIELGKLVPGTRRMTIDNALASIHSELARHRGDNLLLELQQQNQELLRVIQELRERQDEVERLNRELEETNRGVLALYAELDDRAADLKRASEMKSRFLSSISHELRTPLTSVVNIARLLIARTDGELSTEQERQVTLLRDSALGLMEMVNDLLDLAKIEAGKSTLRLTEIPAGDMISALRGMFRPLVDASAVKLVFEDPDPALLLRTDEGKLSQVLRNFISNAVKFTAAGEVRITTRARDDDRVEFSVADTGIGIAPEDQGRIFEEFVQVEGHHQRKVKGTGLGLSLSKKIAQLLGGAITLESTPDIGSVFTLVIPRVHPNLATGDSGRVDGSSARQGSPERVGHV